MDVNTGDLSQKEFRELSLKCKLKGDSSTAANAGFHNVWMCSVTGYTCKDYLCPIVKDAADAKEVREKFLKQK